LELAGIELHARQSYRLQRRERVLDHPDGGAVARRDGGEIVGHLQPAGAGHVLRHHGRIARDMLADMPRHEPGPQVVLAAHADADQNVDRLAAIEIGNRSGARRRSEAGEQDDAGNEEA
jgi:hypothetical protein